MPSNKMSYYFDLGNPKKAWCLSGFSAFETPLSLPRPKSIKLVGHYACKQNLEKYADRFGYKNGKKRYCLRPSPVPPKDLELRIGEINRNIRELHRKLHNRQRRTRRWIRAQARPASQQHQHQHQHQYQQQQSSTELPRTIKIYGGGKLISLYSREGGAYIYNASFPKHADYSVTYDKDGKVSTIHDEFHYPVYVQHQ